jgi:hypothetical protein
MHRAFISRSHSVCLRTSALVVLVLTAPMQRLIGQEVAPGPIVELPTIVVTDSRELPPPESWRYVAIPGFEVLSNASDKATQRLLRDFDLFRQALGHVWTLPAGGTTSLIICGRGGKFDAFVPSARKAATDAAYASLFLKKGVRTAIVIDLQATTLRVLNVEGDQAAEQGIDAGLVSIEHDKQLYREYVRYLLSRSEPRLPAWYEEGVAQIIMRMKFDRRWIQFAKLEDPNTISPSAAFVAGVNAAALAEDPDASTMPGAPAEDRDFNVALQRKALVPMEKFFSITHDAPEALNVLGNNRWSKQAYAFVHLCLYGHKGKFQEKFARFLERSAREPVTEAMFKECFGMSYKSMLLEIRSYCDFTVYTHKEFRAKGDVLIPMPPAPLREATPSEIGRIKGEAFVLAGHDNAARTELIAPYLRGERDPELLAALGLHEQNAGETQRARKFLEAAFAGKTTRAEACIELARLRYADALAQPAVGAEFSAAQVSGVLAPLLIARRQPPPRAGLYELAAETWMHSAVRPQRTDIALLIEGAQLFPMRLKLVYQAAGLSADAGEVEAAHALTDHGVRYATDARAKQRFEELKSSLPALPTPSTSTAPIPTRP